LRVVDAEGRAMGSITFHAILETAP
jgi:hypothetical protein